MLHEISPHVFKPEYFNRKVEYDDVILIFEGDEVLTVEKEGRNIFPAYADVANHIENSARYLFSIDDIAFFLGCLKTKYLPEKFNRLPVRLFREMDPMWMGFAGITGNHLSNWYETHRFCGRCSRAMNHSEKERALVCSECGIIQYPRISPAVMVAVTDGEYILVTKYKGGSYRRFSLVAGFVEVGETLEDAARREVYEETGIKIKNLKYFKSQPWAFSGSLLSGFFAERDGNHEIVIDDVEIGYAAWAHYSEIPCNELFDKTGLSLSSVLISEFYRRCTGK
ncbi:MAG: NAD(+) diphosphatase [Ruminococcaceae bacterium]|nr:NAD(+) diphosphatase [Oscillospiraceae bacterium]